MTDSLTEKKCIPCEGGIPALPAEIVAEYLNTLSDWEANAESTEIKKRFHFKNYYHVMGFVNAVAWMAHGQGHHPDLEVSYNQCLVRYSTHAVNGLTENDFICANKVEKIYSERPGQMR